MILAFAFGISIFFLLLVHTVFILMNWSTVEAGYLLTNNIYSEQTFYYKWCLVFGTNVLLWFIPVCSTDCQDGLDFKASIPVLGQPSYQDVQLSYIRRRRRDSSDSNGDKEELKGLLHEDTI